MTHPSPHRALAMLLGLLLVPLGAVVLVPSAATGSTWGVDVNPKVSATQDLEEFEDRILAGINPRRVRHGKRRIRLFESCLDGLSERWSRRLARTGQLVHRDQDGVAEKCDMPWVGENIVRGYSLRPRTAVRAWWRSPGHRAVMMKARANRAGLGVSRTEDGGYVVVLNVGDTR